MIGGMPYEGRRIHGVFLILVVKVINKETKVKYRLLKMSSSPALLCRRREEQPDFLGWGSELGKCFTPSEKANTVHHRLAQMNTD